MPESDGYI